MASWSIIPSYSDGLRWWKDKANNLLNNVKFLIEVLTKHHNVDTGSDGASALQGFPLQLRYAQGAAVVSNLLNSGDYDVNIVGVDFAATLTQSGAVPLAASFQLDDVTGTGGIDWRERDIFVFGSFLDSVDDLPGGATESHATASYILSAQADAIIRQGIGAGIKAGTTDGSLIGHCWSDVGLVDDAALGAHNLPPAGINSAVRGLDDTTKPDYYIGFFHASSTEGDLMYTISCDSAVQNGDTVTQWFRGWIIGIGQRQA